MRRRVLLFLCDDFSGLKSLISIYYNLHVSYLVFRKHFIIGSVLFYSEDVYNEF